VSLLNLTHLKFVTGSKAMKKEKTIKY